MKSEYINPFLDACTDVFLETTENVLDRVDVSTEKVEFVKYPVTVFLGIAGPLWGQVFYCLDEDTARRTAGKMMGKTTPPKELGETELSAIAELGNMMTGKALQKFEGLGLKLILTPPTVLRGEGFECYFSIPTISIRFTCPLGDIVASVGLVETNKPPEAPVISQK